jgi:hypothetical protein
MRSLTVLSLWSASLGLLAKSNHNRVGGVDLHGLLGAHVSGLGGITKFLGLHNTFHVGGPAVLASHETSWRVSKTVGNNDLLNLIVEDFLYELAQRFSLGLGCLKGGLLLLVLGDVKSFLGGREKFLALVFLELLDGVLINGSTMKISLYPFFLSFSRKGEVSTARLDYPVM